MFTESVTPRQLDDLSALVSDIDVPDRERINMGRLAAHLFHAELLDAGSSRDAELLAILLARWDTNIQDPDADCDDVTEPFEIYLDDMAWVLDRDIGDLRAGLARLSANGVLQATPRGDCVLVSLEPALEHMTAELATRIYRDFYMRQGRLLHQLVEHHLAVMKEHLEEEEARVDRSLVGLKDVREEFDAVQAVATPDDLLALWKDKPQRMYAWLDRLSAVEMALATATGYHQLGLRRELHSLEDARILICSGGHHLSATL